MRKVLYVTGTRADFGLMSRTLQRIHASPVLKLQIAVTGMHLSPTYGETVSEIEAAGLPIDARIPIPVESSTGQQMAEGVGQVILGLAECLARQRPDLVLLLGDRGEMLAGAIAALYQNLPIAHIHGGERSGTVDEPVRHAISKLAHYHFVATAQSRDRLIRMGEREGSIFVTGAPGLDGINEISSPSRAEWCREYGFDPGRPLALFVYHPVVQEADRAAQQATDSLLGALDAGLQLLVLLPNADAGGDAIRTGLLAYRHDARVRVLTHLPRDRYLAALARFDALLGNSSSGIVEAASFNLPVINIGTRQTERERSGNVTDVPAERGAVCRTIKSALANPRGPWTNIYGDGRAGERIMSLLESLPLDPPLLAKTNAY